MSIVLGVFAGMLLKGFYSMVKIEEPASYSYSVSKLERSRGKIATQYIGFRTIPVFVATLGVVVTARRLMLHDWVTFFACALSFVCLSSGRALVERIKSGMRDAPFHCIVLIGEIIGSFVVGATSLLFSSYLESFVPEPREFVSGAWTALFVALVYRGMRTVSRAPRSLSPCDRLRLVREDVGDDIWNDIYDMAKDKAVPWCVLAAIVVVEVTERPRWVRKCERIFSSLMFHKVKMSFGVTQEQSKRPLTDCEALSQTCDWIKRELSDETINTLMAPYHTAQNQPGHSSFRTELDFCFKEVERIANERNPDGIYGGIVSHCARELYQNVSLKR